MKLSVQERLVLLNILPRQGDVTTLRIVRDLQNDLSFSEAEHKVLQFKQENGRIEWKAAGDVEKEVEIGPKAHRFIADTLEGKSKENELGLEHLPLYERFCEK